MVSLVNSGSIISCLPQMSYQKMRYRRSYGTKLANVHAVHQMADDSCTSHHMQRSIYTLGTGSLEKYFHFDIKEAPYEIYRTECGGEVTYHGPGQLVMYPILNLRYHKMDLHWHFRSLEEVIIRVLSSTFSIKASRIDGLTGVWVGNKKMAAVGIRVSRWITFHGLAVNVTTDLSPFQRIVPCDLSPWSY